MMYCLISRNLFKIWQILTIMGIHIYDNQHVITIGPKTICLYLTNKVDSSLKHEIYYQAQ